MEALTHSAGRRRAREARKALQVSAHTTARAQEENLLLQDRQRAKSERFLLRAINNTAMNVQETGSEPQPSPKPRAHKRQRGKKKSARSTSPRAQEAKLLLQDRVRAKYERKLLYDTRVRLRDTRVRLHNFDAGRLTEIVHLFRRKSSLPISDPERAEDDRLRRSAVAYLMSVREKRGIESSGDTALWEDVSTDITKELNRRFGRENFRTLRLHS